MERKNHLKLSSRLYLTIIINKMEKSKYQIETENNPPIAPRIEKRKVIKESPFSPCKKGEIVTVKRYGTFGCWDEQNRWVYFYNTESV